MDYRNIDFEFDNDTKSYKRPNSIFLNALKFTGGALLIGTGIAGIIAYNKEKYKAIDNAPTAETYVQEGDTLEKYARGEGLKTRDMINKYNERVIAENEKYRFVDGVGPRCLVEKDGKIRTGTKIKLPDVNGDGLVGKEAIEKNKN